MTVYRRLLCSC